jgi:hypothetical protein
MQIMGSRRAVNAQDFSPEGFPQRLQPSSFKLPTEGIRAWCNTYNWLLDLD